MRLFGGVDILVNNVGGGEPSVRFEEISDASWDKYIRFNLYGAFYMTREVFPYMMRQKSGKIVNISSGYAIGGGDYCAHYATAKAGLIGFTTSVAREAAPYNVNVNVIPVATTDTQSKCTLCPIFPFHDVFSVPFCHILYQHTLAAVWRYNLSGDIARCLRH